MGDERERFRRLNQPLLPMGRVEDIFPAGPGGGAVPLRVLVPAGAGAGEALPALLFLHGGGWVIGGHETVEPQCRHLANAARAVVISVEYRCAPEYPFPAAVDDCLWATRWVRDNAAMLGIDPRRVAVGGDSAGGGPAAVAAQQTRDAGDPALAHQLLLFPATSMVFDTPSYTENDEGPFLTRPMMDRFRALYISDPAPWRDTRASPARAEDLGGLPPATRVTASHDPLRDEGAAYGRRPCRRRRTGPAPQLRGLYPRLPVLGRPHRRRLRGAGLRCRGPARLLRRLTAAGARDGAGLRRSPYRMNLLRSAFFASSPTRSRTSAASMVTVSPPRSGAV
ncbi:MAG: alpha/beta hydrolase [Alphaproteobacteria bacterium]|nr:alpha/beta hydrolase [Alphaproteobacteria bacterium]